MYSKYLVDGEIKPEYTKTFISIFDGWLGEANLHKLDEVTAKDWSKFNDLIRKVAQVYKIQRVDSEKEIFVPVNDVEKLLSNYEEAMDKDSSEFTRIFIPSLDCIISEDWDYTYILWCSNSESVEKLKPLIEEAGLFSFRD